jgi:hypothetical protein
LAYTLGASHSATSGISACLVPMILPFKPAIHLARAFCYKTMERAVYSLRVRALFEKFSKSIKARVKYSFLDIMNLITSIQLIDQDESK